MKKAPKILVLIAFVLSFASLSTAQQVSIGLRSGINWSGVYTTAGLDALTPDFTSLNALHVAAVAEIGISEHFAIQPEIVYSRKGFVVSEDFNLELFDIPLPVGVTAESRFGYIDVPLLAKYKFGSAQVGGYVAAGPTFGYALNGRLITRADALLDIKISDTDINLNSIDYERWEVGAAAAAGLTVHTGFGQIFADARYTRGFTQLYDIPVVDENIKNQGFALSLGFLVPLSGAKIRP